MLRSKTPLTKKICDQVFLLLREHGTAQKAFVNHVDSDIQPGHFWQVAEIVTRVKQKIDELMRGEIEVSGEIYKVKTEANFKKTLQSFFVDVITTTPIFERHQNGLTWSKFKEKYHNIDNVEVD